MAELCGIDAPSGDTTWPANSAEGLVIVEVAMARVKCDPLA